ncbi:LOLA3 protein, partial [Acromyrmex insinuator]
MVHVSGFYRRKRQNHVTNCYAKHQCPNCPSIFVWKCTLRRHLRNECGREPRFKCPYCDYRGKWKANITRHIKRVHKNCYNYVVVTN